MDIELKNIYRKFNNKVALSDIFIKLDLDKNDIIGLIGPNGAGKTTLLKILSGLLLPSSGMLKIDNGNIDYQKWVKENISFILSGDRNLYFRNTAYENITYFGAIKGISNDIVKKKINYYKELLGIRNLLEREVGTLSMGERKKISIITGLCANSKILIMDEPSTGLDIDSVFEVQNIIKKLNESENILCIVSSHDINFLSKIANNYIFIKNGSIVYEISKIMNSDDIVNKYLSMKMEV